MPWTPGSTTGAQMASDWNAFTADGGIALAKLVQIPTATILGRVLAGNGPVVPLTGAEARQVLALAQIAASGSAADLASGDLPAARFTDASHGNRAGGGLHANASTGEAGFMSAADKSKLNGIESGAQVNDPVDLSYDPNTRTVQSSAGNDAVLPIFSSAAPGLVPMSPGPNLFLRSDGAWVDFGTTPPTGGGGGGTTTPPPGGTTNPDPLGTYNAYRALADTHSHGGDGLSEEHEHVMELVPRSDRDKVAVQSGSWFLPETWYPLGVPGNGAKVGIPAGTIVTYDQIGANTIFSLRVDGTLSFSRIVNTKLFVDTMVVSPTGKLEIGTPTAPCLAKAEIIFATGSINVTYDPKLFSRGLISHGIVSIYGEVKTPFVKVASLAAGATQMTLQSGVANWKVGDEIILTGTRKKGFYIHSAPPYNGFFAPTEDERITITNIAGSIITFTPALVYAHQGVNGFLPYAANLTRTITFSSPPGTPVAQRAHTMFMHSNAVKCYYAAFKDMGRTDKSVPAADIGTISPVTPTSNPKGRYSVHLHKIGTMNQAVPGIVEGCVVDGNPGWGYTHHSSHAEFNKNVAYNCFGACFASEDGDETGIWQDNIAIKTRGFDYSAAAVKDAADYARHDNGRTGDGYFNASRVVKMKRCVAANTTHGYVWFSRSAPIRPFSANLDHPEAAFGEKLINVEHPQIPGFEDNEAFGCTVGLIVVKSNNNQNHDVRSVFKNSNFWQCREALDITYTGHYTFINFKCYGMTPTDQQDPSVGTATTQVAERGIQIATNTFDIAFVGCHVQGFNEAIRDEESFTFAMADNDYTRFFIDQTFTGNNSNYVGFTTTSPVRSRFLSSADLVPGRLTFVTYQDLTNISLGQNLNLNGLKSDSILVRDRSIGEDGAFLGWFENLGPFVNMPGQGYYMQAGKPVILLPDLIADRVTGELLRITHKVTINATEAEFKAYAWVASNGGGNYLGELPTAPFMNDLLNDTNGVALSAHTADLGGGWSAQFENTSAFTVNTNRIFPVGTIAHFVSAVTPANANYRVEANLRVVTLETGDSIGITGRVQSGVATFYQVRWRQSTGQWQLIKVVAGTTTVLGSFADTLSAGTDRGIMLAMNGSSIKMFIDGIERASVTDTSITTAGKIGVRSNSLAGSASIGIHISDVRAIAL